MQFSSTGPRFSKWKQYCAKTQSFPAPGVAIFVQNLRRNHIDIVFFSAPGVAFPERLFGYIKTSICLKLNLGNMWKWKKGKTLTRGPEVLRTLVTKIALILFSPNFQTFLSEKTKCLFVLKAPISKEIFSAIKSNQNFLFKHISSFGCCFFTSSFSD